MDTVTCEHDKTDTAAPAHPRLADVTFTWRKGGHPLGVVLDGLVQLDLLQVHPEDLLPAHNVGPVDADLPIEPARPQQRLQRSRV